MKKLITTALITVLITAMSINVFASGVPGNQNIDVEAKYVDNTTTPGVYSVDVQWDNMQFTYSKTGTKAWKSDTHTYTDNTNGSWSVDGNTIKVTNHSNRELNVSFTFSKEVSITENISGNFSIETKDLNAGIENNVGGADSVTSALTLVGDLGKNKTAFTKIGAITVSLDENTRN